jgi:uncharacterized protein
MIKFGLQQEDINSLNTIFVQYPEIEQVLLYGSRAKGNFKPASDIDLTIIDEGLTFSQVLEIDNKIDDLLLPYYVDLSQKKTISNPDLIAHIERVGQTFYKKSNP